MWKMIIKKLLPKLMKGEIRVKDKEYSSEKIL